MATRSHVHRLALPVFALFVCWASSGPSILGAQELNQLANELPRLLSERRGNFELLVTKRERLRELTVALSHLAGHDRATLYGLYGRCCAATGQFAEAARAFREAAEATPASHLNRGWLAELQLEALLRGGLFGEVPEWFRWLPPLASSQPIAQWAQLVPNFSRLVGRPAPKVPMKDAQGKLLRIVDLHGQVVVLFYWRSDDPHSSASLRPLAELRKKLEGRPLTWIWVNAENNRQASRKMVQELELPPLHIEAADCTRDPLARSFGVENTNVLVAIDERGVVRWNGVYAGNFFERFLPELVTDAELRQLGLLGESPGSPAFAKDTLESASIGDPATRTLYDQAMQAHRQGRYAEAIDSATQVVRSNGKLWQGYYLRGLAREALHELDTALSDFTQALKIAPNEPTVLVSLAGIHLELRQFEAAERDIRRALSNSQSPPETHYMHALVLFASGNYQQALEALQRGLKSAPEDPAYRDLESIVKRVLAGPAWKDRFSHESGSYVIHTDVSAEYAQAMGQALERILAVYKKQLSFRTKQQPFTVYVFSTREGFQEYTQAIRGDRAEHEAGWYSPQLRQLMLWKQQDDPWYEPTLRTLYHEAFHQYLDQALREVPTWFNEGLAGYFEDTKIIDEKTFWVGMMDRESLKVAHIALHGAQRKEEKLTLAGLLGLSAEQFYDPPTMSRNYALAWSFIYFCLNFENGRYRNLLSEYFEALRKGKSQAQANAQVFSEKHLKVVEPAWTQWVRSTYRQSAGLHE